MKRASFRIQMKTIVAMINAIVYMGQSWGGRAEKKRVENGSRDCGGRTNDRLFAHGANSINIYIWIIYVRFVLLSLSLSLLRLYHRDGYLNVCCLHTHCQHTYVRASYQLYIVCERAGFIWIFSVFLQRVWRTIYSTQFMFSLYLCLCLSNDFCDSDPSFLVAVISGCFFFCGNITLVIRSRWMFEHNYIFI